MKIIHFHLFSWFEVFMKPKSSKQIISEIHNLEKSILVGSLVVQGERVEIVQGEVEDKESIQRWSMAVLAWWAKKRRKPYKKGRKPSGKGKDVSKKRGKRRISTYQQESLYGHSFSFNYFLCPSLDGVYQISLSILPLTSWISLLSLMSIFLLSPLKRVLFLPGFWSRRQVRLKSRKW